MLLPDRLMQHVSPEPNTGCYLWTAAIHPNGYGLTSVKGRTRLAHRVAYEAIYGAIPDGLHIDHLCRVRSCVNPQHLEAVTPAENIHRGQTGIHEKSRTHCDNGHEYTVANTHIYRGYRECRECHRLREADRRKRLVSKTDWDNLRPDGTRYREPKCTLPKQKAHTGK